MFVPKFDLDTPVKYYLLNLGCKSAPAQPAVADEEDDDLFGDNAPANEAPKKISMKEMMAAKKAEAAEKKKPAKAPLVAKSSVNFSVTPDSGCEDMEKLYPDHIKKIEMDGLVWGLGASISPGPVTGIYNVKFGCVIEDDKVGQADIEDALETLGMTEEMKKKYLDAKNSGDLEDIDEEEFDGRMIRSVTCTAFSKL